MRPACRKVDCGAVPAIPSGSSSRSMRRCTCSLRRGVWRRSCSQIPTVAVGGDAASAPSGVGLWYVCVPTLLCIYAGVSALSIASSILASERCSSHVGFVAYLRKKLQRRRCLTPLTSEST
jgi:hypothetical protein